MSMEALYQFLKWCTILNIGLLLLSTVLMMLLKDWAYNLHKRLFSIEKQAFNNIVYGFLGLYKLLIFMFNLIPLLALMIMH